VALANERCGSSIGSPCGRRALLLNSSLSLNAQAILLLTAPLIAGRGTNVSPDLLTVGEYKRLARHLRSADRQPADLLSPDASELVRECHAIIVEDRLKRLLGRGFLLSQAFERWHARAIWVLSRADSNYPRRLKSRLKDDAPAVLYGCGELSLLDQGGLAVVGSRDVDDSLIKHTETIGRLSAEAGKILVSGGARGIDRAAMRGALENGGRATGVLAEDLERAALNRENRDWLIGRQLTLVSPYDPSAGFNVGHAMQRNKLIYALADAALVVSSDYEKGGTWAGAVEQLEKLHLIPLYVRSVGETGNGLQALLRKGALPWPNPKDPDALAALFDMAPRGVAEPAEQTEFPLVVQTVSPAGFAGKKALTESRTELPAGQPITPERSETIESALQPIAGPADSLFDAVREILKHLLIVPKKDREIATELQVSNIQAKEWLQRLVDEGVLEKQKKPVRFTVKQRSLL
jgi:DNA processing protein